MFTACPLGAFSRWHYLFDERIEILMGMEIKVSYWLGCPWHSPTEWFLSKWPVWALLMNINVELCPFLRRVSSSLPLQLFCRHKSTPLKSDIIIFSSFTADRSLQPVIYQSPVVSQAKLSLVFLTRFIGCGVWRFILRMTSGSGFNETQHRVILFGSMFY